MGPILDPLGGRSVSTLRSRITRERVTVVAGALSLASARTIVLSQSSGHKGDNLASARTIVLSQPSGHKCNSLVVT